MQLLNEFYISESVYFCPNHDVLVAKLLFCSGLGCGSDGVRAKVLDMRWLWI